MTRVLAMACWWPRVAIFILGLPRRLESTGLPEFLAALTPDGRSKPRPALTPEEAGRVIYNVLRWNVGPYRNGCFSRSFARYHYFRRLGVPVAFHLGVEESPTGAGADAAESFAHLRGHAWLTLAGEPYLEWQPERFARYRELYRYPPAPASASALGSKA